MSLSIYMNPPTVLAITKRTAELCGTQSLLYAAGLNLVTATNMMAARSVINAIRVRGVIVCRGSWSEEERNGIVSELAANYPEISVTVRCPGCSGCNEGTHTLGTLRDTLPLEQFMANTLLRN